VWQPKKESTHFLRGMLKKGDVIKVADNDDDDGD
jgi:hypothetical protein